LIKTGCAFDMWIRLVYYLLAHSIAYLFTYVGGYGPRNDSKMAMKRH